jgi:hypothetical protein
MSSVRFNARPYTSHEQLYPFRDAGVVEERPTDIHSAMTKCPFVVIMSYIHKGFRCSHR